MKNTNRQEKLFKLSLAKEKEDLTDVYIEQLKDEIVSAISKSSFLASSDIIFRIKLLKEGTYLFDVKFLAQNLFLKYNKPN